MVNFKNRINNKPIDRIVDPIELYLTLDRRSDKGPLRPAQEAILKELNLKRDEKDMIVKLNTGQGKTLIGLLMLQSYLNNEEGPALYLCPNKYLVEQTCLQADSFGIKYVVDGGTLPDDFLDSKKIYITTVQKLFNGDSAFKLKTRSIPIGALIMDDAHACIEIIRDSYTIKVDNQSTIYKQVLHLFSSELEEQGRGTYQDILHRDFDSYLPIPYWAWENKQSAVAKILSNNKDTSEIKYTWPLLRDILAHCVCIISGSGMEITPYLPPLDIFGSYSKAKHRIFMSASLIDDAFFIKGLDLDPHTIENPLTYEDEGWSGEKMIIIPSEIDESLSRENIVMQMAKKNEKRKYGVVVLAPSKKIAEEWEKNGAVITYTKNIGEHIDKLKNEKCEETVVIMNRYDGIDLPDNTCRILIIDSMPYSGSLLDRYVEQCRVTSNITLLKKIIKVEQGLGRGVRGEKDYCAIVIINEELVRFILTKQTKRLFSPQTKRQIEIGAEIVSMAKDEKDQTDPFNIYKNLIVQLLRRDVDWKEFYIERMNSGLDKLVKISVSNILVKEKEAEKLYQNEEFIDAVEKIQEILDQNVDLDETEKGWYLQEMARYSYKYSLSKSNEFQKQARKKNGNLLKISFQPDTNVSEIGQQRIKRLKERISNFSDFKELQLANEKIFKDLTFGTKSSSFESALDELGKILGFETEMPDKQYKKGPDNIWKLNDKHYIIFECKNEVELSRVEISATETGQMNNHIAWFKQKYPSSTAKYILIIPLKKLSTTASFVQEVGLMRSSKLKTFIQNVQNFFNEFNGYDLKDLDEEKISHLLTAHKLDIESLMNNYSDLSHMQNPLI